ncbi:hypothetical protein EDD16DRAFT_1615788 [Pisolithus croceorrhizus]|nr:hypothetical protein EDD16DRAFT_1615788 [Pisolithus croceorrhizus]KAI6109854.1 hypothetical protein F5141DRAFT_1004597 [Pisolithus sp. B1]
MDRFLAPTTSEAMAHSHLTENWFSWDQDHPSFNETLVAGCASYQAFNRYLSDSDLLIVPRTRSELQSVLRRYAYDSIHNAISVSRQTLQPGGYSRICGLAEKSIRNVLSKDDNTEVLLALHAPKLASQPASERTIPSAGIRI